MNPSRIRRMRYNLLVFSNTPYYSLIFWKCMRKMKTRCRGFPAAVSLQKQRPPGIKETGEIRFCRISPVFAGQLSAIRSPGNRRTCGPPDFFYAAEEPPRHLQQTGFPSLLNAAERSLPALRMPALPLTPANPRSVPQRHFPLHKPHNSIP